MKIKKFRLKQIIKEELEKAWLAESKQIRDWGYGSSLDADELRDIADEMETGKGGGPGRTPLGSHFELSPNAKEGAEVFWYETVDGDMLSKEDPRHGDGAAKEVSGVITRISAPPDLGGPVTSTPEGPYVLVKHAGGTVEINPEWFDSVYLTGGEGARIPGEGDAVTAIKNVLYNHFSLTEEQFSFDVSEDFEGQYSVISRGGLIKLMKTTGRPNPTSVLEEIEEALQQAGYGTEFGDDGVLTAFAGEAEGIPGEGWSITFKSYSDEDIGGRQLPLSVDGEDIEVKRVTTQTGRFARWSLLMVPKHDWNPARAPYKPWAHTTGVKVYKDGAIKGYLTNILNSAGKRLEDRGDTLSLKPWPTLEAALDYAEAEGLI